MNSISINIKNTKPQYWRRVLFHDKAILGLFFLVLDIILIIFYFGFINSCINKVKKSTQRKLYPLIDNINRKLFNMRSLYLMINQDLSYVNIYIIPPFIEANVLLKNILFDSQSSEDRANTQDNKNINYNDKNLIKNKETLKTSKNNKTKDILKSNIDIKGLGLL